MRIKNIRQALFIAGIVILFVIIIEGIILYVGQMDYKVTVYTSQFYVPEFDLYISTEYARSGPTRIYFGQDSTSRDNCIVVRVGGRDYIPKSCYYRKSDSTILINEAISYKYSEIRIHTAFFEDFGLTRFNSIAMGPNKEITDSLYKIAFLSPSEIEITRKGQEVPYKVLNQSRFSKWFSDIDEDSYWAGTKKSDASKFGVSEEVVYHASEPNLYIHVISDSEGKKFYFGNSEISTTNLIALSDHESVDVENVTLYYSPQDTAILLPNISPQIIKLQSDDIDINTVICEDLDIYEQVAKIDDDELTHSLNEHLSAMYRITIYPTGKLQITKDGRVVKIEQLRKRG